MSVSESTAVSLQAQFKGLPVQNIFKQLSSRYPKQIGFSTSFSYEDQVITDLIIKSGAAISVFTLDTGRLFNETYTVWSQTLEKYNIRIKAFYPDKKQLQFFVSQNGPNAFYQSVELRKQCCHIRKVIPLKKALEGQAIWITGLRAEHSPERSSLNGFEWDEANHIIKYHPLLQWTTEGIKNYIKENEVPYNPLHEKGFVSIGCSPCTRAVKDGEDFRAGRWWWEGGEKKECGLHAGNEQIKIQN